MTEEILFGSPQKGDKERTGLDKVFTVYNASPVNPNTANREVLSILYNDSQVSDILKKREEKGYYNETKSTHFRIVSTGKIAGSQTRHSIAVVMGSLNGAGNSGLFTHYWNDNYIDQ